MKQKLFSFLFAIVASIGTMFASVTINGIAYELNGTTATVVSGGNYTGTIVIPASVTYNEVVYSVTSIGGLAFYKCSSLTSVTIPNSVTSIGDNAFAYCSGLTSVKIPNSVTSIGDYAFFNCRSLTSVTIGNSVTSIGQCAFAYCSSLTSVTIGNSVASIGDGAFKNVANIVYNGTATGTPWGARSVNGYVDGNLVYESATKTKLLACFSSIATGEINLPNSVISIGDNAFYSCIGLTSIIIPNNVVSIGNQTFYNCSSLASVTIGNNVTSIGNSAFSGCSSLTSVTIPNSVTSIGYKAFYNCSGLTTVTIPNSVTSIGTSAFYGCSSLTSMVWNAKNYSDFAADNTPFVQYLTPSGRLLFDLRSQFTSFTFGNEVEHIPANLCNGMVNLTSVTIGSGVTSIGDDAFKGCSNITSVVWNTKNCNGWNFGSQVTSFIFGNEVEVIPAGICSGMNKLTSIEIPANVTSIGENAFSGCGNLKQLTINSTAVAGKAYSSSENLTTIFGTQVEEYNIGEAVTAIGSYAMYNASSLQAFTLPSSVLSIGHRAFDACPQLKQVTINSNAVMSKAYSPSNNFSTIFGAQVQTYTLGESVASIGDYAFCGCANITTLTLPNNVAQVGNGTFQGCTGITSFAIPQTVTTIGDYAFSTCTGIQTLNIPNATSIGKGAFADCSNLTAVQLGNGLISLGDSAFSSCYNLQAITFPSTLQTIGNYAFYQCNRFTTIDIPGSVTFLGEGAFKGCTKLNSVSINSNAVMSKAYSNTSNFSTIFGSQVQFFTLSDAITAIGDYAFYKYTSLSSITIPNNVATIGNSAFYGCTSLPAIALPDNVTTIGSSAFYGCTGLTSMIIPEHVTSLGESTFSGCTKLTSVSINSNAVMSKAYSPSNNFSTIFGSQVQSFTLSDAVTAIGDYAFYGCTSLPAITIPDNVATIGSSAFYGCTGLKSMVIPEHVTSLEESTFSGCTALASAQLPDAVTAIKDKAFYNCSSLTLDSLPASITHIGSEAFAGCSSLAAVNIPASLTTVGASAFADCIGIAKVEISDLTAWCKIGFANLQANPLFYARNLYLGNELLNELVIPNGITELKDWTFNNCSSINSVLIPNTVRTLTPTTFGDCGNITSVEWHAKAIDDYASASTAPFYASRSKISSFVLGEEVEHVPAYLCNGMSKISSLALPSYIKTIGDYAFKDLTKIKQINIPNEVTSIGTHAFDSCILVTSIYLGYQVEEIGDYAFKGCIRVNDITSMNTTTPVVYDNTLSSISQYAYLYIPAGSKRAYQLDPYWSRFDIQELASEEASLPRDAVTVEANADNAIFTWPVCDTAAYYSLQITKDEVVFCTLVFNSNGQLTGIAFAPGRNGNAHAPAAAMSIAGMSFTVTGLNAASKYVYRLAVSDEDKVELVAYSGEFATTGYAGEVNPGGEPIATAVDDITTNAKSTTKILRDNQVLILRDDKTYTIQGVEVK